jgi:hypothetical protein
MTARDVASGLSRRPATGVFFALMDRHHVHQCKPQIVAPGCDDRFWRILLKKSAVAQNDVR